jgi:hypothetical protein
MDYEYCVICGQQTERAGKGDDSMFYELTNGEELGPLCYHCMDVLERLRES